MGFSFTSARHASSYRPSSARYNQPWTSSPAGPAWLHGASRETYTGRWVRQFPVWLARLLLGSSVMAKGLRSIRTTFAEQSVVSDVLVGNGLNGRDRFAVRRVAEEVFESSLQFEVALHRDAPADDGAASHPAELRLEQREQAAFNRQPGHGDGQCRIVDPAQRARDEDVDVARAAGAGRLGDLGLEIAQIRHRRGRHVRNAGMAGRDRGRHRARGWRRGAGSLYARVHVGLVVVTHVQHVVVALEHPR